ncbi:VOC family protein [Brevundimonas sp. R86498]|uniref:VOC family protein n=1 Tax=Brevundimonas sp. R86498 TaxID=3093845 RepID=UPI0037CA8FE2
MSRMIFVNLPVSDLARSVAFYEAVGATKNPAFSDDTAACMVVSDTIFVMLLTHPKFASFTARTIADRSTVQAMLCLSCDSKAAVMDQLAAATAAGGTPDPTPEQDYDGFMYGRSYEDPDGHIWEIMWMDPAAARQGAAAHETA